MALRRMWDASLPPSSPPRWEAAAGYIGGNTPHVWTAAEWAATTARYWLPIFVRSHDGDPRADAAFSVNWLAQHGVPKGVTLALDYETRVDATYLQAFDRAVVAAGWKVMVYGTRRTVLQNPKPSGGYWDAQWTNVPHLNSGSAATQYGGDVTLGQLWDASLVADSTPLWDTQGGTMAFGDDEKRYLDWLALWIAGRSNRVFNPDAIAARLEVAVDFKTPPGAEEIGGLATGLAAIDERLDGLKVEVDVSKLTPDQLTLIGSVMAGRAVITGLQAASDGTFTVTFAPAP